ncbi:MAG: F0F1 ATP synthase subunit epsilon [Deltaproteobacteria bacterium]|nr:F0F1 ATP synthase subunit epsilon [Deltaproteobacteria bacterium]NIS76804.1 F0F1 ATP synthase subunit epsilon [Deltaproteobacteria bacterium]
MEERIRLEIVTPERLLLSEDVDEVIAPGHLGEFGVLPEHTPFLALLDIGILRYRSGTDETQLAVSGGFAEVLENKVVILARTAEFGREIDVERARRALERAEKGLEGLSLGDELYVKLEAKLRRALVRLQASG